MDNSPGEHLRDNLFGIQLRMQMAVKQSYFKHRLYSAAVTDLQWILKMLYRQIKGTFIQLR